MNECNHLVYKSTTELVRNWINFPLCGEYNYGKFIYSCGLHMNNRLRMITSLRVTFRRPYFKTNCESTNNQLPIANLCKYLNGYRFDCNIKLIIIMLIWQTFISILLANPHVSPPKCVRDMEQEHLIQDECWWVDGCNSLWYVECVRVRPAELVVLLVHAKSHNTRISMRPRLF